MRTRKIPPHTEREREGEGPTRFLCPMRASELKIVGERERKRENRSPGEGGSRFMH